MPSGTSLSDSPEPTPRMTRPGEAAERGERLGDQRRVVAKRRGQHAGAQQDPLRAGGERAQPRQRGRRVTVVVPPRLKWSLMKTESKPTSSARTA